MLHKLDQKGSLPPSSYMYLAGMQTNCNERFFVAVVAACRLKSLSICVINLLKLDYRVTPGNFLDHDLLTSFSLFSLLSYFISTFVIYLCFTLFILFFSGRLKRDEMYFNCMMSIDFCCQ
jgi:hypothetical protein